MVEMFAFLAPNHSSDTLILVSTEFKGIKNAFKFLSLFLLAVGAHISAGGTFVAFSQMATFLLLVSGVVLLFRSLPNDGPALALAITIVQSVSHFILGGGTYTNGFTMTIGHFASGFISYLMISKFDNAWDRTSDFLTQLIRPRFAVVVVKQVSTSVVQTVDFFKDKFIEHRSLKYRGPPVEMDYDYAT